MRRIPRPLLQREGADVLALEHTPAAQDVAVLGGAGAVEAAADRREFLVDGDIVAEDAPVMDEERSRRERCDAAADQMDLRRARVDTRASVCEGTGRSCHRQLLPGS